MASGGSGVLAKNGSRRGTALRGTDPISGVRVVELIDSAVKGEEQKGDLIATVNYHSK